MSIVILAVVLALAALAAVFMPRPIQRTSALAWFSCVVLFALDITEPAVALFVLSVLLGVIDLLFFREPKPVDDIGDRQTFEAIRDKRDALQAKAKVDAAMETGDYSDISDRDLELYDYPSEFERRRLRRAIIKAKGLGGLYGSEA